MSIAENHTEEMTIKWLFALGYQFDRAFVIPSPNRQEHPADA